MVTSWILERWQDPWREIAMERVTAFIQHNAPERTLCWQNFSGLNDVLQTQVHLQCKAKITIKETPALSASSQVF